MNKKQQKAIKRALKVKQKNPKYIEHVVKSTVGEMRGRPDIADKVYKEKSFRRKAVHNYFKRLEKQRRKK